MEHEVLGIPVAWLAIASAITFVGTLVLVPVMIVRMPADYFLQDSPPEESFRGRHPWLVMALRIAKNLLGALLFVTGLVMVLLPGQGIITMLLGLTLLEFPGKRALELSLIRRERVHRTLDWIRARFGGEPLRLPGEEDQPERAADSA